MAGAQWWQEDPNTPPDEHPIWEWKTTTSCSGWYCNLCSSWESGGHSGGKTHGKHVGQWLSRGAPRVTGGSASSGTASSADGLAQRLAATEQIVERVCQQMVDLNARVEQAERRLTEGVDMVAARDRRITELEETVQTMNTLLEDLAGRFTTREAASSSWSSWERW